MREKKLTEVDTVSSYSAMMHPNEDLSDLGSPKEEQPVKLGAFKRMVAWIDENWLKKLLVKHDSEQIRAADEIDDMIQAIIEEDPLDKQQARQKQHMLSISPMIRATIEQQRALELKRGNRKSASLLDPGLYNPSSMLHRSVTQ